ncbi:MAG: hypothetical protein Fur0041_15520 [Bacteroidia bacterium]
MKKLICCFFILSAIILNAQQTKVPLLLHQKLKNIPASQYTGILVEGNSGLIHERIKLYGGFITYSQGNIHSIQIPAGAVDAFSREDCVKSIGNAPYNMSVLNDTMKAQTRVYDVRNGTAPLTQGYTGKNVVMGIIDSGIDFTHPDFQDSTGHSRIMFLWDQRDTSGTAPSPWSYGTEWDSAQINSGQCTHNDLQYYGHGTHISGIAGGNGRSVTAVDFSGVAPDVKFVVVALDFVGINSPVAVADAAAYIYSKALAMGLPCVINASVGDYMGSHDGQDLQAQMIDTLLNTPGRLFVGAAGNAGNLPIHLSYPVSSDTNFTWYTVGSGSIYIQLWADINNFSNAKMAVGCTQQAPVWQDKGRTAFTNIGSNYLVYSYDTLYNSSNQRLGTIMRYASTQGNAYSMEFLITPDSLNGYYWSLELTGSGHFHSWSFDMVDANLPTTSQFPRIAYYKLPDATHNIVSSFQCSDKVVTVGNYVNRTTWPNVNNYWTIDTTLVAGEIMWNSSIGPTRDGRTKPDITAPGANSMSCGVLSMLPGIIAGAPEAVAIGGYHVQGGGTSASSPVVAGCGALWLERYPNSTWSEFKTAVINCAKQDTFTGSQLPDNTWGWGKMDAFSMMTNCALHVDDINLNENQTLHIYPNPLHPGDVLNISIDAEDQTLIEITDISGRIIQTMSSANATTVQISLSGYATGMYFIRTAKGSAKFIIQ